MVTCTPQPSFIPFIREVDNFARETANPTGFQEHGHDIVKVDCINNTYIMFLFRLFTCQSKQEPHSRTDLWSCDCQQIVMLMIQLLTMCIMIWYENCVTRIQEFLTSQKQTFATQKGRASTAGQNLRDTLLSQHTNLHSHTKN